MNPVLNHEIEVLKKKSKQLDQLLTELQAKAVLNFGYKGDGTYDWQWCDCEPPCGDEHKDCLWRGSRRYNCDDCENGGLYAARIEGGMAI